MKLNKKKIIILTVAAIGLALYVASSRYQEKHSVQGYVETDNLYLASPYSGVLEALPVSRGQTVNQGDLVFKLDENPEALQLREAVSVLAQSIYVLKDLKAPKREQEQAIRLAAIEQVNSRLELAKLRMNRFEKLYKLRAGTRDEADAAKQRFNELLDLKKQREEEYKLSTLGARSSQILAQKQKIKSVIARKDFFEWQVEQKKLYAPAQGIIFDTFYSVGEWVPAGKPIAALLVAKNVHIEFFVSAMMLKKLQLGKEIYVTCAGCKSREKAKISYISPEAEYTPPLVYSRDNYEKIVFRIKADPLKPNLFKPGQPVTVSGL